jgi:hypothetical protein
LPPTHETPVVKDYRDLSIYFYLKTWLFIIVYSSCVWLHMNIAEQHKFYLRKIRDTSAICRSWRQERHSAITFNNFCRAFFFH